MISYGFALSAAAFVLVFSWRITEGAHATLRYMVPFALVGLLMTWHCDLGFRWKLTLSTLLLVFLIPMVL